MPGRTSADHHARRIATQVAELLQHHEARDADAFRALNGSIDSLRASMAIISADMGHVKSNSEAVRTAVVGDDLAERSGLLKRLALVEEQIHGDDDRPGLAGRMRSIEDFRDKLWRYAVAIALASSVGAGGVGAGVGEGIKTAFRSFFGG